MLDLHGSLSQGGIKIRTVVFITVPALMEKTYSHVFPKSVQLLGEIIYKSSIAVGIRSLQSIANQRVRCKDSNSESGVIFKPPECLDISVWCWCVDVTYLVCVFAGAVLLVELQLVLAVLVWQGVVGLEPLLAFRHGQLLFLHTQHFLKHMQHTINLPKPQEQTARAPLRSLSWKENDNVIKCIAAWERPFRHFLLYIVLGVGWGGNTLSSNWILCLSKSSHRF